MMRRFRNGRGKFQVISPRGATRQGRGLRFESLESRRMLAGTDSYLLSVFVNGAAEAIPANVGVQAGGGMASSFTTAADGKVFFTAGSGTTLGDFFTTWRSNAGQAGNNVDALFDRTQVLGRQVDATHALQVFVNGRVRTDYGSYVVQPGDDVAIVYDTHPVVALSTNFGAILVELFQDTKPATVANFLNYVNDGAYANTFFHRSASNFVVQAGGFTTPSTTFTNTSQFSTIPTDPPVVNEPGISNLRGTIAMAKLGGNPNSATSQWFFNLKDNSADLNDQNGGFTVFGKALSMTTVDKIAALPINKTNASPYNELPVSAANQLAVVATAEGLGSITGVRFVDANGDGVRQTGEAGLSGATVYVDANGNGALDSGEISAITASDGGYRLDLLPGTYTIRIVPTTGQALTLPGTSDRYSVTVTVGGVTTSRDFGEWTPTAPTGIDLATSSDTGSSSDDDLTRLNNSAGKTLQFALAGVHAGAEVRLLADGIVVGTATATGTTVTVTTTGGTTLADGDHLITATQVFGGVTSAASAALTIHVDATPPAPITTTSPSTVPFNGTYSYDPASADEGQPGVAYSISGGPGTMFINPTTGQVTWDLVGPASPRSITLSLSDAAGNSTSEQIELTVLGDIPILPDGYQVDEDGTLTVDATLGVLVNDGDSQSGTLTASVVSQPSHGSLTLNGDGSFQYKPSANFFGTDSFTYTATNGTTTGNVARATITVAAQPDAPQPQADSYNVMEDIQLVVPVATGVMANDADADGDPLTVALDVGPTKGTLALQADGSFTYAPAANANGTDSFTYRVSDGTTTSAPVTVTLNIAAVNDAPTATADSYSVNEDATLTVPVGTGVLANDADVEGSAVTATVTTNPAHGTLTLNADGSFTYTPTANYAGPDSFTYRASDGTSQSAATTVSITVVSVADPPTAAADAASIVNDGSVHPIAVLTNDSSNPDGAQTLSVDAVTQGSQGGVVAISSDGTQVRYTPKSGFVGTETFTYTIRDTDGLTSTATVTATVTAPTQTAVVSGFAYLDLNNNGTKDATDIGIPGVLVTLTGTTNANVAVTRGAITGADGSYSFTALQAGTYKVTESQPNVVADSGDASATTGATVANDAISNIVVADAATAAGNNFGEGKFSAAYTSIVWFFASSQSNRSFLRGIVAQGVADAGNASLAAAILAGNTTFPVTTPSGAALPVSAAASSLTATTLQTAELNADLVAAALSLPVDDDDDLATVDLFANNAVPRNDSAPTPSSTADSANEDATDAAFAEMMID